MSFARKLLLSALMATAALTMTATSASALEVSEEGGGALAHCGSVTPATHGEGDGGCSFDLVSEGTDVEWGSPVGMLVCANDFEGRVDEAGAGYIYDQALTSCDPTSLVPCREAGETQNWPFQLTSPTTAELKYCIDIPAAGLMDIDCHLAGIAVDQVSHGVIEFFVGPGGGDHLSCEQIGYSYAAHWVATPDGSHPAMEISE